VIIETRKMEEQSKWHCILSIRVNNDVIVKDYSGNFIFIHRFISYLIWFQ
jgi:hypothetical protein